MADSGVRYLQIRAAESAAAGPTPSHGHHGRWARSARRGAPANARV